MDHISVPVTPEIGQLVNDLSEAMDVDLGVSLGILAAQGLSVYAAVLRRKRMEGLASRYVEQLCDVGRLSVDHVEIPVQLVLNGEAH